MHYTLATVYTSHHTFTVLVTDTDDAHAALRQAWANHCKVFTEADAGLMDEIIDDGGVVFTPMTLGVVLRNGEPIPPAHTPGAFIPIEQLKVGDIAAGAEVTAIRQTAKRVYYTVNGAELPQAKGTRIFVEREG